MRGKENKKFSLEPSGDKHHLEYLMRTLIFLSKELHSSVLAKYDLTDIQGRTLGYISEHQNNELMQKDLEKILYRRGSSITSMLKGLERKGLITRKIDPKNERKKQIQLTPEADILIKEFYDLFAETEKTLLEGFSEEEKKIFFEFLSRAIENLRKKTKQTEHNH